MHHPCPQHMETLDNWAVELSCDGNTDLDITIISCHAVWYDRKRAAMSHSCSRTHWAMKCFPLCLLWRSWHLLIVTQTVWKLPD